jgi:hypothetical protein
VRSHFLTRGVVIGILATTVVAVGTIPAASASDRVAIAARDASGDVVVARDVSFPQCRGALPRESSAHFGVLGTNNGMSFTRNPCLVRQLAWAKRLALPPAFYANTGNPGPQRAKHWPLGQMLPRECSWSEPNSIGCSYDYGWNSAWQSYTVATDAAERLHHVDRVNARHRAANVEWWLDVETMNSWQALDGQPTLAAQRRDAATIQGEVDALRAAGVESVGIYSTAFQWKLIAGDYRVTQGRFAGLPQWLAGYESHEGAINGCGHDGFTGGPVRLTQYLGQDGFDSNVLCAQFDGT